jgi:glycosyltransferase involved in cell wall biosynthesis
VSGLQPFALPGRQPFATYFWPVRDPSRPPLRSNRNVTSIPSDAAASGRPEPTANIASERLRIALVAPPLLPVPPPTYAGTERIIASLGTALHRRGHRVTLIAPGDSDVPYEVVPTVERSLWASGFRGEIGAYMQHTAGVAWRESGRFDIIHSHLEGHTFLLSRHCPVPVVTTLHGRLDAAGMPELLDEFRDVSLVAISENQRRWHPAAGWVATIHHGLPLEAMPFEPDPGEYLAFVGRITPEKGVAEAVEVARQAGRRLRVAAKVLDDHEREHYEEVVVPAVDDGIVEFVGEVGEDERDPLLGGALATLMLGPWPEPFGLVAIESMATGTPVIARRAGALTETVEHGVTGFIVDDVSEAMLALEKVAGLDRQRVRDRAIARFSVERMVDEYEAVYRQLLDEPHRRVRRAGDPAPASAARSAAGS